MALTFKVISPSKFKQLAYLIVDGSNHLDNGSFVGDVILGFVNGTETTISGEHGHKDYESTYGFQIVED